MSANEMAEFYVHTATVETYQGTNGYGQDQFATARTVPCYVDDTRRLVRSKDAQQVVSESTLYTYPTNGVLFPADSRVTVNGNTSRVIRTNINDSGALDLPDHVAVSLT